MKKYKYLDEETLKQIQQFYFDIDINADGKYSGRHKSFLIGRSLDFLQHREYYYGDDIKLIDWKVYGRREKYFIKQFHQETNLDVYMLLDCSKSMFYPEHSFTKYEYASFIVSYLSYVFLSQSDRVGVAKFDNKIKEILSASSNESYYYRILEFLEKDVSSTYSEFANVIDAFLSIVKKNTVIFFISDLLCENEKMLVRMLKNLVSYGVMLYVLHIVCKEERELRFDVDNVNFIDIENESVNIKTDVQEIKDMYKDEFNKMLEYFSKELNLKNSRYLLVDTSLSIIENLKIILT
ncbi:MAG: DUF58 domain-containing protein [Endomicrobia bacterium]|nr:DUF58 domain-containing protein [Endomicrobiia bacterium]